MTRKRGPSKAIFEESTSTFAFLSVRIGFTAFCFDGIIYLCDCVCSFTVSSDQTMKADVTVIGLGNWASSLLAALRRAGIPVREVVSRTRRSGAVKLKDARLDAQILWLCVPDGAIADAAGEIVERRHEQGSMLRGQLVVHSSGALTVA